jgi:hypothetical protein
MAELQRPAEYNEDYNEQSNLLDGLYEFHPGHFESLSPEEFDILQKYYLLGVSDIPENVFVYRANLVKSDPSIEGEALRVYQKVLRIAGVE